MLQAAIFMPQPGKFDNLSWHTPQTLTPVSYVCGYCGPNVSSEKGYKIIATGNANTQYGGVFICPRCQAPTYFPSQEKRQVPGPSIGHGVNHVPIALNTLYEEARSCVSNTNFTASVLVCRKMLMNIAVEQGAKANLKFIEGWLKLNAHINIRSPAIHSDPRRVHV